MERIAPALTAVSLLLVAACGEDEPAAVPETVPATVPDADPEAPPDTEPDSEPDTGTVDGSWRLVEGTVDGAPVPLVADFDVTLDVDGDRAGGRAACNSYGGTIDVGADGSIAIGALAATEMACRPDVMAVEAAILGALPTVSTSELVGDRLVLTGPAATLTFEPVAPVPTADIVGTTWLLDTVIDGDVASGFPGQAMLRLDPDGTLDGTTGCRGLTGEWVESGAEIVFVTFSAVDDPTAGACAPDAERLDGIIVSVLGDGFTAEVDGDRLTVTAPGGVGLSYVADR